MECEPEELQFLGVVGIYRFSAEILRGQHRPLFARIAAAFVLPLSALFLLHIAISHALFTHIDSDDNALDASSPGTDTQRRLLSRLASDWLALLLFKSAYLLALLLLSLLSVAASVFSVASVYSAKHDALTFPRVLSVVPRVWRRLAATFLAAFALLFAYHAVAVLVFVGLLVAADNGSGLAGLVLFLVAIAYIVGLVYLSVVWHLASVVSVLEDFKGFAAMRKSKDLIKGKLVTAGFIFFTLNLVFAVVELGFRAWVVKGSGAGSRLLLGLLMLAALCCVVMFALVTQTVVYLVCKSYHHESLDKANISDHLEVYLGDYVPLKASDVQMEQFQTYYQLWRSGTEGHFMADCPKKYQTSDSLVPHGTSLKGAQSHQGSTPGKAAGKACFRCQEEGHLVANCPKKYPLLFSNRDTQKQNLSPSKGKICNQTPVQVPQSSCAKGTSFICGDMDHSINQSPKACKSVTRKLQSPQPSNTPGQHTSSQGPCQPMSDNTSMKSNTPKKPVKRVCYHCREKGHSANLCLQKNQHLLDGRSQNQIPIELEPPVVSDSGAQGQGSQLQQNHTGNQANLEVAKEDKNTQSAI